MPGRIERVQSISQTMFNTKNQSQNNTQNNNFNKKPTIPVDNIVDSFEKSPDITDAEEMQRAYYDAAEAQKGRTR